MRRYMTLLAICLLAATLFTIPASAQCMPNALPSITGIWGFKLSGFNVAGGPGMGFIAAAGKFIATVGPNVRANNAPTGFIQSWITINHNGTTFTTLMPVSGTYQVDNQARPGDPPDCTTGTILLASGTNPSTVRSVRYQLHEGGTKMFLVSVDNDGVVLSGEASRY